MNEQSIEPLPDDAAPPVLRGPKRQHYLPRFYLQGFIGPDNCVAVYDRDAHQVRRQQPANTAVTGHLYTLTDEEGRQRFELEQFLGQVEGRTSALMPRLLAGEHLEGEDRAEIAMFAALLAVRTPQFIDSIKAFNGEMIKQLMRVMYADVDAVMERIREEADYEGMSEAELRREAELQVGLAQGDRLQVTTNHQWAVTMALPLAERIAPIFMQRDWTIITSPPRSAFITSDAPIGLSTVKRRDNPFWGVGFGNADALVLLPLDNQHALAMFGDGGRTFARQADGGQVRRTNLHIAGGTQRFLMARDNALAESIAQGARLHESKWRPRFVTD